MIALAVLAVIAAGTGAYIVWAIRTWRPPDWVLWEREMHTTVPYVDWLSDRIGGGS